MAIDFQAALGWERVRGRIAELTGYVSRRLDGLAGLTAATPAHPALYGSMRAFRLPAGADVTALRRGLWETYRIEVPVVERPEGPLVRTSTHFYNTEEEIDRLAEALPQLLMPLAA
jgi:isopenicillin-N epimerase